MVERPVYRYPAKVRLEGPVTEAVDELEREVQKETEILKRMRTNNGQPVRFRIDNEVTLLITDDGKYVGRYISLFGSRTANEGRTRSMGDVYVQNLLEETARFFSIRIDDMKGGSRKRNISDARKAFLYIANEWFGDTYGSQDRLAGMIGLEHSAVHYARSRVGECNIGDYDPGRMEEAIAKVSARLRRPRMRRLPATGTYGKRA